MINMSVRVLYILFIVIFLSCKSTRFNVDNSINYCLNQTKKTIELLPSDSIKIPRSVHKDSSNWKCVNYKDWTSGFWPGILWYAYEYSHDSSYKNAADKYSNELNPLVYKSAYSHDLGFKMYCSFGNGFRITQNESYKKKLLVTADTLATLYNPKVGTILSWPVYVKQFGPHNTIMDNMMNLELLFWAAKNGGGDELYNIAVNHATKTANNHFRDDYTCYHVMLYDTVTGKKIKGVTHQGYNDSSTWARGQAWAIYGFTMCFRETKNPLFLTTAEKAADTYLHILPSDLIPNWDFNAPDEHIKDVSALCITASALLELSELISDKAKSKMYRKKAETMLYNISNKKFQSRNINSSFLLHSTGNKPAGIEIDASIIYADYYYLEALLRLKKLQK